MASIHERPGSKYLHAAWRDSAGKLNLRSTKQTERGKAMEVALAYERTDKLAGRGEATEAQVREVLNDILKKTGSDNQLRNPTIEAFMKDWLASKEVSRSAGTAARYHGIVDSLFEYLGKRRVRSVSSLTPKDIQGFLDHRQSNGISAGTLRLILVVLRIVLNRARRLGLVLTNVAEAVDLPKGVAQQRKTFTQAEVEMLVAAAEGEMKTLVMLGYFTGARLGDCSQMKWESVDLAGGTLSFVQQKTGGDPLTIPMHPDMLAHLEGLAGTDTAQEYVMPGLAEKLGGGGLSILFAALVRAAGLDAGTITTATGRQFSARSFHSLRHSFTSALANAGVVPELRMKLTGHSSESIHAGYTHQELATLRAAVEKLPGLAAK